MSIDALTWAFKQDLKTGPKFVLIVIADMADDEASCYPGMPTIAKRVGSSVSAARANVDRLIDDGWITEERRHRTNGSRTSNRYVINALAPESDATSKRANHDGLAPESGHPSAGIKGALNPQITPSTEPTVKRAGRATQLDPEFSITGPMREWALTETPLVDLDRVLPEWVDYWTGRGAVMKDWVATWRNGMRKQQGFAERAAATGRRSTQQSPTERAQSILELGRQMAEHDQQHEQKGIRS